MSSLEAGSLTSAIADTDRRATVLDSALVTFARFGYRKTSMEVVAQAARISRPGLYFLFGSKEILFRAAVTQALERDIAEVQRVLAGADRSLQGRLLEAFDQWAGRYIGPLSRDIPAVVEDNPDLLRPALETMPRRFEQLVIDAISAESGPETARKVARTLISTSIGIKHQVDTRGLYLERLQVAIDVLAR